jgi:hypothetical protein
MSRGGYGLADTQRRIRAAALDAQARDWTAERADRLGFARLWPVYHSIQAARRYTKQPFDHPLWITASFGLLFVVPTVILLLADEPAAPLTLAVASGAAVLAADAVLAVARLVRILTDHRRPDGPAPIDDPYLYAETTRRLEAARSTTPENDTGTADLDRALFWLASARDELTTRTW